MKDITGFNGEIKFDPSKPDGNPRKLLNLERMDSLGWKSSTTLESGLNKTYDWFIKNIA
jgi:GDP-L-fucose synthase